MINFKTVLLTLCAAAGLHAQCAGGGLAVVVTKTNSTDGVSLAQLRKLVLGDVQAWPDKSKVMLVSPGEGPVFQCLISQVVRMSVSEYRKYVMSAEFRGEEPIRTKAADSPASAARVVSGAAGAFTVVDAATLQGLGGSVKVLSINGKQPGQPGYPL